MIDVLEEKLKEKLEIACKNYIESLLRYKKPIFEIKKRYVKVRETIMDDNTIEYDISSPRSSIIRGLVNPSSAELNEVITDYKITENKEKTKKLERIPVYFERN